MEVTGPENQAQKQIPRRPEPPSLACSTERDVMCISAYQIRSLHPLGNATAAESLICHCHPAGFLSRGAFHNLAAVFA